jgi:hypothetical protein
MEQYALPIALISLVLMLIIAYLVATYVQWSRLKKFAFPQFEDYAVHVRGCGLIYPAIFTYCAFGLTRLV